MRLAQQGMTFDDLAAAIRDATTVSAVGRMPSDYRQYLMVSATEAHSADDIADVVVGHGLRVRDLATVTPGTERSEEHTSELQSRLHLVCRLLLEKKKNKFRLV